MTTKRKTKDLCHGHSLSLTVLAVLILWIFLFMHSDPGRWKTFFGNAIADWLGAFIIIVITKYLHERGSAESRPFEDYARTPLTRFFVEHSLSLFLGAMLGLSLFLWNYFDADSQWAEVAGNVVSQFVQLLALVLLTKKLFERGSKGA